MSTIVQQNIKCSILRNVMAHSENVNWLVVYIYNNRKRFGNFYLMLLFYVFYVTLLYVMPFKKCAT